MKGRATSISMRAADRVRRGRLVDAIRRLGPSELGLILGLLIAAGGIWMFAALAGEMVEGDLDAFDERLLLLFRSTADPADPIGPVWLEEAMRDLTALGSIVVLTVVTLAVAAYQALAGRRHAALFVLLAIGSGVVLSFAIKHGFERPRPDLVPHAARVFTASFPSGHSSMSATAFLTLGALLARVQPTRPLKVYVVGLALLLTIGVGVSRIYLGVHWPSDVLGGWVLGGSWALLCWIVFLWLQSRGEVEQGG